MLSPSSCQRFARTKKANQGKLLAVHIDKYTHYTCPAGLDTVVPLGEVSSGEQRAGIMSNERNLFSGFREEITQLQLQLELQLQALEIIDEILSGTAPTESEARRSLTWHVAHHPGHPQRALLMHLLTLPRSDHR
jgi:hypothetical protein